MHRARADTEEHGDEREFHEPLEQYSGHPERANEAEVQKIAEQPAAEPHGSVAETPQLDEVPDDIPGRCNTSLLFPVVPPSCQRAVLFSLDDRHPAVAAAKGPHWPIMLSESVEEERIVIEARIKRKGQSRVPISPAVLVVINTRLSVQSDGRTPHLFGVFHGRIIKYAGAFFVIKPGNLAKGKPPSLRMILDARSGNHVISMGDRPHPFSLFTLEALVQVISNLAGKTWWAVNADLRHWFHQIPLPERWRAYFVLHGTNLAPRSVPMGCIFGPYVGNGCTWGMLFAQQKCNSDAAPEGLRASRAAFADKAGLDVDLFERLWADDAELPPWVPLVGGGGIFVILDNIFVATPNRKLAIWWAQRIEAQTRRFNALLKLETDADGNALPLEAEELSPTNNHEVTFLGVKWSCNSRRLDVSPDDRLQGVDPATGAWHGTYRDVAQNLGKLWWWARVSSFPPTSPPMRQLRELYRYGVPPQALINAPGSSYPKAYDTHVVFDDDDRPGCNAMSRLWAERAESTPIAAQRLITPCVAARAAVDASRSDAHS